MFCASQKNFKVFVVLSNKFKFLEEFLTTIYYDWSTTIKIKILFLSTIELGTKILMQYYQQELKESQI